MSKRPMLSPEEPFVGGSETNDWYELTPPRRTADIYVFSLLRRPDGRDRRAPKQHKPNPLDLGHWKFSVLDTATLDRERPDQKGIAFNPLMKIVQGSAHGSAGIRYGDLKAAVDRLVEALPSSS